MNNYGYNAAKLQKQLPLDERLEKTVTVNMILSKCRMRV